MQVEMARVGEIAPGGMKMVKTGESEIVLCNCDGKYYALSRRCGHMNAPLEMGALDGTILTCAMHHVQFDVTTGEALNYPISEYLEGELPPDWARFMTHVGMLMNHITVCNIRTLPVKRSGGAIIVELG